MSLYCLGQINEVKRMKYFSLNFFCFSFLGGLGVLLCGWLTKNHTQDRLQP